jgi:hypothetical protein
MTEAPPRSPANAVLREPLFHFVLAAALLFAVGSMFGGDDDVIEITQDEIEWRILQFEAQEGRALTEEERLLVFERYIDERVLVREARAEGLDQDERIDDILVQKMLHVLSGEVIQPTDEELAAYYAMNADRYATDATVTVDEVVVQAGQDLPASVRAGGEPSAAPEVSLIASRIMPGLSLDDLTRLVGEEAADVVFDAEQGEWVDAYESPRGQHWFRVRERTPSTIPSLEVVREAARLDWITEQEDRRLLARVAELRARYDIRVAGEQP